MLRSNPHALYSQLASPYASHLYGLMPGAPPNLSGLHERMKLEEDHRNRIAREEEKARIAREEEKAREREREMRDKEMREREQRDREIREQREKEMREREQRELREKEMREREQRDKEHREREMREKDMREREKLLQQHHFMQSQRNPYNLLGLFPSMVGLRPPSSMHPGYPMHHSLLGLPLPSQIPTSLSSSLSMSHHSQSPQTGSSSAPITSAANLSLMSSMGAIGMNHSGHSMSHGMSLYPGNLPPPAHLYSPLAPPSASPSGLSNSSYNHSMMNPATSPQPMTRSPSSMLTQQSLNLSKNPISLSPQYSSKGMEIRSTAEPMKHASSSSNLSALPSIATVSVTSILNEKNFKIEIPNISNGNNEAKDFNAGSIKNEAKDLSSVKVEKPKEEKTASSDDLKPIVGEKTNSDNNKISDNDGMKPEEKVERIKEENKIKAENQPQDFTSSKDFNSKEIKSESDDKTLSSDDNKIVESEKMTDNLGSKEGAAEAKEDETNVDEKPSIIEDSNLNDENSASTKNNETSKTSNKK